MPSVLPGRPTAVVPVMLLVALASFGIAQDQEESSPALGRANFPIWPEEEPLAPASSAEPDLSFDSCTACNGGRSLIQRLQDTDALLSDCWPDRLGERYRKFKDTHKLPLTIGAWHWWHVSNGGPTPSGYGIPTLNGTYYYYVQASPEMSVGWRGISKIGAYADVRFRDSGDPFRAFVPGTIAWHDAAYVWALTPMGVWKAGSVWKRFGIDWDGSWRGGVQYFDGFKLDTDWGVAWERTPTFRNDFKLDSYVQFFFHENSVNGSLVGADPESVIGASERNTLVTRVVPTWQLGDGRTLALGLSGLLGQVDSEPVVSLAGTTGAIVDPGDEAVSAWAIDLTYANGNLKAYAEALQCFGNLNPARYTSGGASNRLTEWLVGINYKLGPIAWRLNYSMGFDDHPAATHFMLVPGLTVTLTQNVDIYLEYVREEVRGHAVADFIEFEDAFEILLHWHF